MKFFSSFSRGSKKGPPLGAEPTASPRTDTTAHDPRFLEFFKLFLALGCEAKLFPKKCRACGKEFKTFPEYIHDTHAVGHGLEDYSEAMRKPLTMQYRNCPCGSTLVLALTEDVFPLMERFWNTMKEVAEESDRPFKEVVNAFREQCNLFVIAEREKKLAHDRESGT